jgi:hypothetical protein
LVASTVAAVGWAQSPTVPEPAGNETLGIAEFQVNETDSSLVIAGLDTRENRTCSVEVKIGRFVMSDGFAEGREGPERNVDGRRIDIECLGVKLHHESEGYYQLQLPFPPFREYLPMQLFLADAHVSPVLHSQGISFRYSRANRTTAGTQEVADCMHEEVRCSEYDSHHLGPGLDCQQYSGNEPNGFSMNTCNNLGAQSDGCSNTSIADPNYFSGYYTDQLQFCFGRSVAEKTAVPQPGGVSPCGVGGPYGTAACWEINPLAPGRMWCVGSGDNCEDGQRVCEDANSEIHVTWSENLLHGVWGSGASDVWAAGGSGAILHWDGGAWTSVDSGTANLLLGVWGSGASDAWAVGFSGAILHWDGSAWTSVSSGTSNDLFGVWGSEASDVWAVGVGGTILNWDGSGWTSIPSGTTAVLHGVWGSEASDVWTVGNSGTILHWDGSGWTRIPSGTSNDLFGVGGSGASDVWAVGRFGTIQHWDGTAWTSVSSGTGVILNGVWASEASDAWAVGFGGTILHWDGSAWTSVPSGTSSYLFGVWGSGASDVWAVGMFGTILHWDGIAWTIVSSGTSSFLEGVRDATWQPIRHPVLDSFIGSPLEGEGEED